MCGGSANWASASIRWLLPRTPKSRNPKRPPPTGIDSPATDREFSEEPISDAQLELNDSASVLLPTDPFPHKNLIFPPPPAPPAPPAQEPGKGSPAENPTT